MTEEQKQRLTEHSRMLGRIGSWVSEFLPEKSEATTEEGVLRMLVMLRTYQLDDAERHLQRVIDEREKQTTQE